MKFTRVLCLTVALITAGTSTAELITKTLRITRSDGSVVNIDLSSGQKDGETVLPVLGGRVTPNGSRVIQLRIL